MAKKGENNYQSIERIELYCWLIYIVSISITIVVWYFFIYKLATQPITISESLYEPDNTYWLVISISITYLLIFIAIGIFEKKIIKKKISSWKIYFLYLITLIFFILLFGEYYTWVSALTSDQSLIRIGIRNSTILFFIDMIIKSFAIFGLSKTRIHIENTQPTKINSE